VPRAAIIAGLTAFLVLAGTGFAAAVWTSNVSSLSGTVNGGTLAVTVTPADIAGLNAVYSPSVLTDTAAISVTNTGNVPADYTLLIKAASNGLSNVTTLTGWVVTSLSQCTAGSAVGSPSGSAILSTGLSTNDSVAVGATDIFCARTSIPSTYATTVGAASLPTVLVTYSKGSWSGSLTGSATQSVADTVAPSAPGRPTATGTTAATTKLTWTASTDNVAVTNYDIYRGGTIVGTVAAPVVTFTDSGLTGATNYSYTVKARDAAGNASAASAARLVTTTAFDTSVDYRVTFGSPGLCIDGGVAPPVAGTPLVTLDCQAGRNQTWQFVNVSGSNYKIVSSASPSFVWDISGASTTDGSWVTLWNYSGNNNQLWALGSEGNGKAHFTNLNSGRCLTLYGATQAQNYHIAQYTCDGSASQTFTLTQLP
jgi:hypothetical protein